MPSHAAPQSRATTHHVSPEPVATRGKAPTDINLWDRDALPIARDLLCVLAIFCYLIGFAYQTAKMSRFGIPVDLGDQQLTSLFTWALDAIGEGLLAYGGIFCATMLAFFAAGYVRNRYAAAPFCRTLVHLLIAAAIMFAVFASVYEAWHEGLAKGDDYLSGREPTVGLLFDLAKRSPFGDDKEPMPHVYVLSETPDSYEILKTNPRRAVSVHRADVMLTYDDLQNDVTTLSYDNYATRLHLPTPPPAKTAETN